MRHLVAGESDSVEDAPLLQVLVNVRLGEGGTAARYLFRGKYYVHASKDKGAMVILRLPEHSLEDAPADFHL